MSSLYAPNAITTAFLRPPLFRVRLFSTLFASEFWAYQPTDWLRYKRKITLCAPHFDACTHTTRRHVNVILTSHIHTVAHATALLARVSLHLIASHIGSGPYARTHTPTGTCALRQCATCACVHTYVCITLKFLLFRTAWKKKSEIKKRKNKQREYLYVRNWLYITNKNAFSLLSSSLRFGFIVITATAAATAEAAAATLSSRQRAQQQ